MLNRDNTTIKLSGIYPDSGGIAQLKQYTSWLKERNIKYTLIRIPRWAAHPNAINMRNEDALIFKLTFGL